MSNRYKCIECGEEVWLTHSVSKQVWPGLPYLCSAECIVSYIKALPDFTAQRSAFQPRQELDITGDSNPIWDCYTRRHYKSIPEVNFARLLLSEGIEFTYEAHYLPVGTTIYIPDFLVMRKNLMIEIKGVWSPGSRKKFAKVMELYPPETSLMIPSFVCYEFGKEVEEKCRILLNLPELSKKAGRRKWQRI